jgi:hypothetical protein
MQIASTDQQGDRGEIAGITECRQPDLLPALQKLRDDIRRIEETHPDLKTGLTAVCDEVITWVQSNPAEPGAPVVQKKHNPVTRALDFAGSCVVRGLDRAGDGIIFVFESILKLGQRSNSGKRR